MDGASRIGAYLMDSANVAAFGDDGLRSELAHLELRPLGVLLRFRPVVPNRRVFVTRQDLTTVLLCAVGRADLYQFRLGSDGFGNVRVQLRLIAGWVGALCGIWASCKSFLLAPPRRAGRLKREAQSLQNDSLPEHSLYRGHIAHYRE